MSDEEDMLRKQNSVLEAENRLLKKSLHDDFSKAALTGIVAHYGFRINPHTAAAKIYEYADAALEFRKDSA